MSSGNYKLSVNKDHINSLSKSLRSHANDFRQLSNDIRSLYWKLDWETASKERIYEKIKNASDCANNIYNFLLNASKTANSVAGDLYYSDKQVAAKITKDFSNLKRDLKSNSIANSPVSRLASGSHPSIKFINAVNKTTIAPQTYVHKPTAKDVDKTNYDLASIRITGFDWGKFGINPGRFGDSASNIIGTYTNAISAISVMASILHKNYKAFPFKTTGVSFFKFIDESENVFYAFVGKYTPLKNALKGMGIEMARNRNIRIPGTRNVIGIRAVSEIPDEVLEKLVASDGYKNAISNFKKFTLLNNDKFRLRAVISDIDAPVELIEEMQELIPNKLGGIKALTNAFKDAGSEAWQFLNPKLFKSGLGTELRELIETGLKPGIIPKILKSSKVLAAVGIIIDIGFDLKSDWGKWDKVSADVVVDTAFGILTTVATTFVAEAAAGFAASLLADMAIGATIGTLIPIPVVGTVVGAVVGVVVGLVIVGLLECLKINGQSLKDWAKDGVKYLADKIYDGVSFAVDKVGDGISYAADKVGDGVSYVADKVGDGLSDVGDFISSGWHSLFGGGKKTNSVKHAAPMPAKPAVDLVPSTGNMTGSDTSITISNSVYNNLNFA